MNHFNVIVIIALGAAVGSCLIDPCHSLAQIMDGQTPIMQDDLGAAQVDANLDPVPFEPFQESAQMGDPSILQQPYQEAESIYGNPVCPSCANAQRKMAQPQNAYQRRINHARAGCPLLLFKRAAFTYDDKYKGYYVGGGVPNGLRKCRGELRYCDEGTWGVDYVPWYSRVASSWSHGRLYQGGTGQYEPDHKNRPFGQTWGRHFGNRDRSFPKQHGSHADHEPHADHGSYADHASPATHDTGGGHQSNAGHQ